MLNFSDKKITYQLEIKNSKSLKLLLASDNETYGGCQKYPEEVTIKLKKAPAEIEINAFTGFMYEIS